MTSRPKYLVPFLQSIFYSFRNSLLFYPIMLSSGSIVLFLITSTIDNSLTKATVNVPLLEWLLFAGSPHAARSILSTIAAGWATILGVAFSITLISLQLSITNHTAEVIDEFENDKINQVVLGWFILTVIYSLLVLKTVRTEEGADSAFTPVIGVNIAVFLAVIALFIFVVFLHNVKKYLKPSLLIDKIRQHVSAAIDSYKEREADRGASFIDIYNVGQELFQIKSPRDGLLRRVNLSKLRETIIEDDKYYTSQSLWIEFSKRRGDHLWNGASIATVYAVPNLNKTVKQEERVEVKDKELTDTDIKKIEESINNILDISNDRDLLTDPSYGIAILRNIAIKSIMQHDVNSVMSCVSGLYVILVQALKIKNQQSAPLIVNHTTQHAKEHRKSNCSSGIVKIYVNLNEDPIYEKVLVELATIYRVCLTEKETMGAVLEHYSHEYWIHGIEALSASLDDFATLTKWYSPLLSSSIKKGTELTNKDNKYASAYKINYFLKIMGRELHDRYPYALDIFDVHIQKIIEDMS